MEAHPAPSEASPSVEVLGQELLLESRVFDVRAHHIRLPSGREQRLTLVEHPGAVAIAARFEDGRLALVRQYRHAARRWMLEVPEWSPLVNERDGRYTVKVRIVVEGPRPATFRVGDGDLQEAAWPALSCALDAHGCLRGAGMSVALRPAYIWAVSGRRGLSLICEQFVAQPSGTSCVLVDYFM